ncbi:MAG: hypothetical protein M1817_005236 [Caeruleum heppii]|nr:MAG: hypothetical protein M1817_005236 [Caeruleum heppii]
MRLSTVSLSHGSSLRPLLVGLFVSFVCSVAVNTPLVPRKSLDHNLICDNTVPFPGPQLWPEDAPARNTYRGLVDLCAWSQEVANVGCICDHPYETFECTEERALLSLWLAYAAYCYNHCMCAREEDFSSELDYSDTEDVGGGDTEPIRPTPTRATPAWSHYPFRSDEEGVVPSGWFADDYPIEGDDLPVSRRPAPTTVPGFCKGSCTAVTQQCSNRDGGSCRCTARPLGSPHGNIFHFFGACAAVHTRKKLGGHVKRDERGSMVWEGGEETWPCPCNATYVSHQCCDSATGVVWEREEMKLGELRELRLSELLGYRDE